MLIYLPTTPPPIKINSPKIPQPIQKNIDCRPAPPHTFFAGIALSTFKKRKHFVNIDFMYRYILTVLYRTEDPDDKSLILFLNSALRSWAEVVCPRKIYNIWCSLWTSSYRPTLSDKRKDKVPDPLSFNE